ncbi:MAG: class I SAM-dependent methyltransferase [Gammaproteobacteria bacterium]|nr:class I SAM-dependent methyltransferase [Gammaproteobacteria bacterium]
MTDRIVRATTHLAVALSLLCAAPAFAADTALESILTGEHRSEANKARDQYRHPIETLTFFGLRDDMTVVEVFPGGGWYTEILAPYLRDKGIYYAAGFDPDSSANFARRAAKSFKDKMDADPGLYGKVKTTVLAPPDKTAIAPPGSADMVLTFRNIHNWMAAGTADQIFAAMFSALKPGGVLGVVEHRGNPAVPQDPKAKSGYVNQEHAIRLAEKAGFKFVEGSEINANPRDTKDHPKGVWTLPPTFALEDEDRAKYLAIGESDRFTLKFVKP